MFSSSSLSKTMVAHLGHLVQRPSGMSRFLDLPLASLGFLTNDFSAPLDGGGVTAGSEVSRPRGFFMKMVVAMAWWVVDRLVGWNDKIVPRVVAPGPERDNPGF